MYVCKECGGEHLKLSGKCNFCGQWNTLAPFQVATKSVKIKKSNQSFEAIPSSKVKTTKEQYLSVDWQLLGWQELENIFHRGLAVGGSYLLSGEPGIGKSTLILMLSRLMPKIKILYISGEETIQQIKNRMTRMDLSLENLILSNSNEVMSICSELEKNHYSLIFIDSIQTLYSEEIDGIQGSINQIRSCCQLLIQQCKQKNTTLMMIGHINKSGEIAGPKLLEHMVDATILMYSAKNIIDNLEIRVLKPIKNRFATTDKSALFYMNEKGLTPLSKELLIDYFSKSPKEPSIGSCYYPQFIAKKLIFCEIEALVVKSDLSIARRSTEGIQLNRLHRIIAIMEKYCGLKLHPYDIYIHVAGQFKSDAIEMDLCIASCIYSSLQEIALPKNILFLGELGLSGRVKKVNFKNMQKEIELFDDFIYCLADSGKSKKSQNQNKGENKNFNANSKTVPVNSIQGCLSFLDGLKVKQL